LPKDFPWDELQKRGVPLYQPQGCKACRKTGYTGRQGIFELCVNTTAVRQLAHDRATSWQIREAARKDGMRTLREDAWLKVLSGKTSVDEVLRATKGDRI
jgi:general secretion pathway protein E/type IV pilus assembly protein PilB